MRLDTQDPVQEVAAWIEEASQNSHIKYPTVMCLSTLNFEGFPEGRMVLLKGISEGGFVFFTNRQSTKGKSLENCSKVSLVFYWEALGKQVRILGTAQDVSDEDSDVYFHTRPRMSQIGALASSQSELLESRDFLIEKTAQIERLYEGKEVPRPSHWQGYRVIPQKIEFWIEQPYRLHDRFLFSKTESGWECIRLYP